MVSRLVQFLISCFTVLGDVCLVRCSPRLCFHHKVSHIRLGAVVEKSTESWATSVHGERQRQISLSKILVFTYLHDSIFFVYPWELIAWPSLLLQVFFPSYLIGTRENWTLPHSIHATHFLLFRGGSHFSLDSWLLSYIIYSFACYI